MKNLFTLSFLFLVLTGFVNAQLTGITPNSGIPNQTLSTTITGNNIFIQSSSPSGNLYSINLKQGANTITLFDLGMYFNMNTTVVDPNTVTTDFTIPYNALTGVYDLEVITGDVMYPWWNQTTYTLPGAFTVLPPDGYIQGNVFDDVNRNGIKDGGEPNLSGQQIKIMPTNAVIVTDAGGNYSYPVVNGSYSVTYIPISGSNGYKFVSTPNDTIPVTISNNNSTGNDFGLKDAIYSIVPPIGYRGITQTHQLTADEPIFSAGNISYIKINSSPNVYVYPANITIIDPYTIQASVNIPINTNIATALSIDVFTYGTYYGHHLLRNQFEIQDPPAFVSGRFFYDVNHNKISDPNEPGIAFASVQLTPDGTVANTDYTGSFEMGASGGMQTLTPLNNVTGISLFTDSASYTFNAVGNITGKDFGYISSLPPYSLDVFGLYIFPRCNSYQNMKFFVKNTSDIAYDADVFLAYDPLMTYSSSNIIPTLVANDTVHWIVNIQPYTTTSFYITFLLPGPNNTVYATASASSLDAGGVGQLTDQTSNSFFVHCSFDPNDKQVTPEGILAQHFTLMTDTLDYLIRFQNTGNDTALNVVVLDTLDASLDRSTFEVVGSSHSMQTELKANGALKFTFNNIMLPDSNVNEPGSHGYIEYRVRANSSLPDSTAVNNTAYIYFDFNAAVITNTTLNTLVYVLPTGIDELNDADHVTLYPNPFRNTATLQFDNPFGDKYQLTITDVTGKVIMKNVMTDGNKFIIERNQLREGLYFYQLMNVKSQSMQVGKFVIQ